MKVQKYKIGQPKYDRTTKLLMPKFFSFSLFTAVKKSQNPLSRSSLVLPFEAPKVLCT